MQLHWKPLHRLCSWAGYGPTVIQNLPSDSLIFNILNLLQNSTLQTLQRDVHQTVIHMVVRLNAALQELAKILKSHVQHQPQHKNMRMLYINLAM